MTPSCLTASSCLRQLRYAGCLLIGLGLAASANAERPIVWIDGAKVYADKVIVTTFPVSPAATSDSTQGLGPSRATLNALRNQIAASVPEISDVEGFGAMPDIKVLSVSPPFVGRSAAQALSGSDIESVLTRLRATGRFQAVEPDYVLETNAFNPTDGFLIGNQLWGLNGSNGANVPVAWIDSTGVNVVVGVMDTPIDLTHPDLSPNLWRNPGEIGRNGIDDDGNGVVDDLHGVSCFNQLAPPILPLQSSHGTHVAGTIAAVANAGGPHIGVAPNARIMALNFIDDASGLGALSDEIRCLNYAAANEVRVLNGSYGMSTRDANGTPIVRPEPIAERVAFATLRGADVLVALAAGNDSNNNDIYPAWPSNFEFDNIISVAASNITNGLASFSNYGQSKVDLAAPGVTILSTSLAGRYGYLSGTSMAAPHVAGVAALLRALRPEASAQQVRAAILSSVRPGTAYFGRTATKGSLDAATSVTALRSVFIETPSTPGLNPALAEISTSLILPLLACDAGSARDLDSDDDGIPDSAEDANGNKVVDAGETDACNFDSDNDGIPDGVELGVSAPVLDPDGVEGPITATNLEVFSPDMDANTITNPLSFDSDGDGFDDKAEDLNANGALDIGETDPFDANSRPSAVDDGPPEVFTPFDPTSELELKQVPALTPLTATCLLSALLALAWTRIRKFENRIVK